LKPVLPYKIAVLVYVFNDAGELLLLHRVRPPNRNLYSPIGGKLEQDIGESPYACALREVQEEIDVTLTLDDLRLLGMVSERAHEGQQHWLMFCFESLLPQNFAGHTINEGRLQWVPVEKVPELSIPKTDRDVIWPLVLRHSHNLKGARAGDFFSVHIDCTDEANFAVTHEHPRETRT
jgi:8-oxo-dGTP diphosphatase